jgi:hypothetical protein
MPGSRQLAWILFGLLVAGVAVTGCQSDVETVEPVEPVDSVEQLVEIVAYYPLNESHQFIADYLEEVAARHPDKISLEIIDWQTQEGRKRWETTGLGCSGVFVNGSTRHEIVREDGSTETVNFLKRLDSFWTRDDFETVVYELMGEPKPVKEAADEESAEAEADAKAEPGG